MYIKEKLSQNRRDFKAIYKCQFCEHEYESSGYDDANFHQNVVPNFKCPKCDKSGMHKPLTPRYEEGYQI